MIIGLFSAISEGKISKFSPTIVDRYRVFSLIAVSKFTPTIVDDYRGILSHFKMANLNMFFNHGGL